MPDHLPTQTKYNNSFYNVHMVSQRAEYVAQTIAQAYTVIKKNTKLLPITSPDINQFSKFFHWQTR